MSDSADSWSGHGIIQAFFKVKSTELSEETLLEWLDGTYIPALIDTGVVESAFRFKAANEANDKPNMIIYKIKDLAEVKAGKLMEVPRTSKTFPSDTTNVEEFTEYEARTWSLVELFETEKQPHDVATKVSSVALEPAAGGYDDMDAWYRGEHNQDMSHVPGWKRLTRFKHLNSHRFDDKEPAKFTVLALHEFGEGEKLGKDIQVPPEMSPWTMKVMGGVQGMDAAIYHKVKTFGLATKGA